MISADPAGEGISAVDRALLDRAARQLESGAAPGDDLELATAMEFLRVAGAPANAAFARAMAGEEPLPAVDALRIGLVPGAFYRDHPHTGADGAQAHRILGGLGHRAELIPVHSFGSLADNARIIRDWLQRAPATPTILISLSKGTADVKFALADIFSDPAPRPRLVAWISLSGISTGTPLVRWLRRRPWRWWGVWLLLRLRGQRIAVLHELAHGPATPLAAWPAFPPGFLVVHVHGFPLARHLNHRWAPKAYRRLAPLGPNDGGSVLLADVARWPGIVCPLWGVDHYMQPVRDLTPTLQRIFRTVLARCR